MLFIITKFISQNEVLSKEKDKYEQKISNLKNIVNEIKEKYDLELSRKTEIKDKIIYQLTSKIELLER